MSKLTDICTRAKRGWDSVVTDEWVDVSLSGGSDDAAVVKHIATLDPILAKAFVRLYEKERAYCATCRERDCAKGQEGTCAEVAAITALLAERGLTA